MSEPRAHARLTWKRIVGYVISVAIVVAIFVWAIPKYADYHDVVSAIGTLTPIEFWSLVAATIFNLVTYWWGEPGGTAGLGDRQSRGPDPDDDVGREHAPRGRGRSRSG